jgi:hypothetical protein
MVVCWAMLKAMLGHSELAGTAPRKALLPYPALVERFRSIIQPYKQNISCLQYCTGQGAEPYFI